MALLKDLIVTGASKLIGDAYLNTVKSGTWLGTPIDLTHGGTAGTTTANLVLISTGTSGTAAWTAQSNITAGSATNDGSGNTITSTYLKLSGGTMTGVLTIKSNAYYPSSDYGINMSNSDIIGLNSLYTLDTADNTAEGIRFYRDSSHWDSLTANSGDLYFMPNDPLSGTAFTSAYKIYHTGNKPTASDVGAVASRSFYVGTSTVLSSSANLTLTGTMISGIDNTAANALLHSGSSRGDNDAGSTWLFLDDAGGTSSPWGIKHNQPDNYIEYYGSGSRKCYIDLNTNGGFVGNLSGTATYSNYTYVSNHTTDDADYYMTWVVGYDALRRIYASSNGVRYNPANHKLKTSSFHSDLSDIDSLTAGNLIVSGATSLTGDTNAGTITASSFVGPLTGNATTCTYPLGFSGRQTNNNWIGISGLTLLTAWQDPTKGGEIGFWTNGEAQMFCAVDGYFYQGIDLDGASHRVLDTHDVSGSGGSSAGSSLTVNGTTLTIPSSLPANGGNADTVDSKHASDFTPYYTWDAVVKCATWSRICKIVPDSTTTGSSIIFNIKGTRGSVVYNNTYILNVSHTSGYGSLTLLSGTDYSTIKVRVYSNTSANYYIEVYDDANNATSSSTLYVKCSIVPLTSITLTKYTAFTDGTTVDSGYSLVATVESTAGVDLITNYISATTLNGTAVSTLISNAANGLSAYSALGLAGTDVDGIINRWSEVKTFLNGISQGTDLASLLSNYVTLDTAQTISGAKTFSTPISGDLLGNATTADRLKNARTISLTGNVTGSGSFDGSGNLSISTIVSGGSATDSTKLPLAGGTMTGDAPINFTENKIAINFRPNNTSCYSKVQYMTSGDEALVFANKYSATSFMFFSNLDLTNGSNWAGLGTPDILIKKKSLYINSLIANGTDPSYNLYVNGTANITGNTTIGGTLGVTGATTISSTLGVTGATTVTSITASSDANFNGSTSITDLTAGDLIVNGSAKFNSDALFSTITAGTWNGSVIALAYLDMPSWSKASTKPSYTLDEISDGSTYHKLYPYGFSSFTSGATWGDTTGTSFASWNDSTGGSIDFRRDNPSSGKMSIKVDGRVYVNEGTNPVLSAIKTSASGSADYWGMRDPDGTDNWIRTTTSGFIPYTAGGSTAGHSSLGTSSWYFSSAYILNIYGTLNGNASTATRSEYSGRDTFIQSPKGGVFSTLTSSYTGYLRIKMPCGLVNTMMSFFVDIYDYEQNQTATYKIAGYNYEEGWYNYDALCVSSYTGRYSNLTVRFGLLDSKAAISIGESTTTWSYPQVVVRDVLLGFSAGTITNYFDSWTIDFSSTAITEKYNGSGGAITNTGIQARSATYATNDASGNSISATYLKLAGGTMTGSLTVGSTSSNHLIYDWTSGTNSPMMVLKSAENYGIRYHEGSVDKMMLSASGNADSVNADICINGNGDGTVTIRGNTIYHTGNLSPVTITGTQTISGNKTFSGSTVIDSLTAGNLSVTGATSLTGAVNAGTITASSFIKSGGTSSLYLMADGSTSTKPSYSYGDGYLSGFGTAAALNTVGTFSSALHSDFNNNLSDLITRSFMSYWNGAYNSSHSSNLTYCAQGTIIGSNNIGSQSVNYATSSGSTSTLGTDTISITVTVPGAASAATGWYRIALITSTTKGYANLTLRHYGLWNSGEPSNAVINISLSDNRCTLTLISGHSCGVFTKIRAVKISGGKYYIDAYQACDYSSGNSMGSLSFTFEGIGSVTSLNPTTALTTTETAAVSLDLATISGTNITSSNISSLSVNYAASAGSATDSTKVLKAGDTMTGSITFDDVAGIKVASNNHDTAIWTVYDKNSGEGNYGFRLYYKGTGDGDNNALKLVADNLNGTEVEAMSMTQAGVITFAKTLTASISGNAGTVTNGVYTTGALSIAGAKTFTSALTADGGISASTLTVSGAATFSTPISGDLLGNATTADRLKSSTTIGGSTAPVYFVNGVPTACNLSTTYAAYNSNGYLPLTGGTLSNKDNVLSIKSSGSNSWIYFYINSTTAKASIGYYDGLAFLANESDHYRLGIKDDGTPVYRQGSSSSSTTYTLYHTGNLSPITTSNYTSYQVDEKVKQSPSTTNSTFELLFSGTADNTERTEGVKKTSTLTYNPSTYTIGLSSATIKYNSSTGALEIVC